FKKITTQLEQLEERERRAEERERHRQEREQRLMEQQHKLNGAMLKIVDRADNFQQSMVDVEARTKSHLSDYFKDLPKSVTVVQKKEFVFDPSSKFLLSITIVLMLIAGFVGYYFTNQAHKETISYQRKLIREYEGNIEYLQSKIPVKPTKTKKRKKS
ncbi:MAG: hypothetical protein MUF58_21625, partial [Arcicella sp.]|nr:hypothetical protein [Arcicella sp.]